MDKSAMAIRSQFGTLVVAFSTFTPKAWAITTLAAAIGLLVIGLPTASDGIIIQILYDPT